MKLKNNKENSKKDKSIALVQALILVVALFAFAWMLNQEFKVVSAEGGTKKNNEAICSLNSDCISNYCDKTCKTQPTTENQQSSSGGGLGSMALTYGPTVYDVLTQSDTEKTTGANLKNEPSAETPKENWIDKYLGLDSSGLGLERTISSLLNSIVYSGLVAAAAWAILEYIFKASDRNMGYMMDFIWVGLGAGVLTGTILGSSIGGLSSSNAGLIGAAVTLAIIITSFLAGYQTYANEAYSYSASSWNPASGGKSCEKCNDLRYGCSEYQCRSFGKACNITNIGTTDEKCIWMNPNDITGPEITPMNSVLELGYAYKPINTIAPPDKGVRITYNGEGKDNDLCIPPFTDLTLGVNTNEVAECKIDIVKKANMSDMASSMDQGSLMIQNHTVFLPSSAIPSDSAINETNTESNSSYELNAGKTHNFFIRCEDVNGNPSPYSFLMQFCVQSGPDTMSPLIKGTNYLNTTNYISFNTQSAYLQVYVNEPADCKWDFQDLTYDDMDHNMSKCSKKSGDFLIPSMLKYGCETNLTGLKNYEANDFYIRCKDQPWLTNDAKRNKNKVSYKLSLMGTYDLAIENVTVNNKPNNTIIRDSANQTKVTIGVTASGGADEGKVKCQYKFGNNYLNFYNEGSQDYLIENTQSLWLEDGKYNYPIKCFDIAGNTAYSSVGFTIEKDMSSPVIVRAYYEEEKIKLITNEEATCVYSITSCNYNLIDGVEMETTDNLNHYLDWTTETDLFVKCKDNFENRPLQDKCSIIVRGSDF